MKSVLATKSSSSLLNNVRLKKKNAYLKKVTNHISKLKTVLSEKQNHKILNSSVHDNSTTFSNSIIKKKGHIVLYSICFSFSPVNTFLYVTDTVGRLRFRYSAGLLNFKGKAKKSRFQILKLFFKELRKLKINLLRNKPIALNLENVGSYKHLIVRYLKKKFFIRIVNNRQTHPYNGCRKKKKSRK